MKEPSFRGWFFSLSAGIVPGMKRNSVQPPPRLNARKQLEILHLALTAYGWQRLSPGRWVYQPTVKRKGTPHTYKLSTAYTYGSASFSVVGQVDHTWFPVKTYTSPDLLAAFLADPFSVDLAQAVKHYLAICNMGNIEWPEPKMLDIAE